MRFSPRERFIICAALAVLLISAPSLRAQGQQPGGPVPAATVIGTVTTNAGTNTSTANLDIALSALRDALRGSSAKTLTDVVNALNALSVSITGSVTVSGTVAVSNFPATQAISAASLPLPALAASSTKQSDRSQQSQISDGAGNARSANVNASNELLANATVNNFPASYAVTCAGVGCAKDASVTALTKPTDTQYIGDVGGNAATAAAAPAGTERGLITRNIPSGTQPISGTVAVSSAPTTAVTIADAADVTLGAKADAKSAATDTTALTAMQILKEISFMEQNPASRAVTSAIAANFNATVVQGLAANLNMTEASAAAIKTDVDKIPSQGQALAAGSMPVVLTAIQLAALTPPPAISGFALESSQLTGNTSIAGVKTNTDPLVAAGGGAYVRQDSNATIAKESGGNLANAATSLASLDTKTLAQSVASTTTTFIGAALNETTLLASNAARKGAQVCAASARLLLVKLGTGVDSRSFSRALQPGQCFDIGGGGDAIYTGAITGIWLGLDAGGAVVTEF